MEAIIVAILIALVGWFVAIRYKEFCKKRERFEKEYSNFADPLFRFIDAIQSKKISLNTSLLTEFESHRLAKEIFIKNLSGSRLNRFKQKWAEYEDEYNQVNNLGVLGIAGAIAPSQEALAHATANNAANWEADRKKRIHCIITELLKASKVKIWF